MSVMLNRIDDPRDTLQKATRDELFFFAQSSGVTEIIHNMPADLMRKILRNKGLNNIPIPNRILGGPPGHVMPSAAITTDTVAEVDAEADLERQWRQQQQEQPAAPRAETNPDKMSIGELRTACKTRGIKMDRRDNMITLREKVRGQNAA